MEAKQDVLIEASQMLEEPGKNTKRKILTAVNGVFLIALVLHLVIQLVNTGTLPDPTRDLVFFPILLIINGWSFYYNYQVLSEKIPLSQKKDKQSAWVTMVFAMILCLVIVHLNENTAMSMLVDFGLSVSVLFAVGIVLGRNMAIFWFVLSMVSLFLAYHLRGYGFEYHLLTQDEINAFNQALQNGDIEASDRISQLKDNALRPFSLGLYVSVWFIYFLIAFLAVFFESNVITKIADVIPAVISKINIASQEKHKLEQDNMRMGMELDVARKIQKMMLPKLEELGALKSVEIAARMDPATEVGGDFYECLPQADGSIILAMGDVTDHGLQSGLVMMMAQSTIRTLTDGIKTELTHAINRVNTVLYRSIHDRMDDSRNLTLLLAKVNIDSITVCGQHESILYYDLKTNQIENISTADLGIYVGLIEDISEYVSEKSLPFHVGDTFMFYTDGLTEAENDQGEFYGEERMEKIFKQYATKGTQALVDAVYRDVYSFIGNKEILDDITVMAMRKLN